MMGSLVVVCVVVFHERKEIKIDNKIYGYYIFGGALVGAVFGLAGAGIIGALAGAFIGWFIAAAILENQKQNRENK